MFYNEIKMVVDRYNREDFSVKNHSVDKQKEWIISKVKDHIPQPYEIINKYLSSTAVNSYFLDCAKQFPALYECIYFMKKERVDYFVFKSSLTAKNAKKFDKDLAALIHTIIIEEISPFFDRIFVDTTSLSKRTNALFTKEALALTKKDSIFSKLSRAILKQISILINKF